MSPLSRRQQTSQEHRPYLIVLLASEKAVAEDHRTGGCTGNGLSLYPRAAGGGPWRRWPSGGSLGTTWSKLPDFTKTPLPTTAGGCGHCDCGHTCHVCCQAQMHSLWLGRSGSSRHPAGHGAGGGGHLRTPPRVKIMCFDFSVLMTEMERTPV